MPSLDDAAADQQTVPSEDVPAPAADQQTVPSLDDPAANKQTVPSLDDPAADQQNLPSLDDPATDQQTLPSLDDPATDQQTMPSLGDPAAKGAFTYYVICRGGRGFPKDDGGEEGGLWSDDVIQNRSISGFLYLKKLFKPNNYAIIYCKQPVF